MADNNKADKLDRRQFLAGVGTALIISGAALIHPGEAWGLEVKNLKPETMRTLIKMARDIYPHDRLADRFYAIAMRGYDEKAGSDAATRVLLETGVSTLDELARKKHGVAYANVGWEAERVALLRQIENDKFFQTVRVAAHNVKTAARTSKLTPARPVESSVPTRRARSNRK
jgi:hypothetical protein